MKIDKKKFTIIGTSRSDLNFEEVTILGADNWKKDRIAVRLKTGIEIRVRPINLSPIVNGTKGKLDGIIKAGFNGRQVEFASYQLNDSKEIDRYHVKINSNNQNIKVRPENFIPKVENKFIN